MHYLAFRLVYEAGPVLVSCGLTRVLPLLCTLCARARRAARRADEDYYRHVTTDEYYRHVTTAAVHTVRLSTTRGATC